MSHPSFLCTICLRSGKFLGTGSVISRTPTHLFILTAGHVLRTENLSDKIYSAEDISVVMQNDGIQSDKKEKCHGIVAYSLPTAENGLLDYALLKVDVRGSSAKAIEPRPLSKPNSVSPEVTGYGAVKDGNSPIKYVHFRAQLEGSEWSADSPEVFHYNLKGSFPAERGYSGGPLMIVRQNKPQIIGVLSHRGEPQCGVVGQHALEQKIYATPISRIARDIPNWKRIINPASFWMNYEHLHKFHVPLVSFTSKRECFSFNQVEENAFENHVAIIADNHMKDAMQRVSSTLTACKSWVDPRVRDNPIVLDGIHQRPVFEEDGFTWIAVLENCITSKERADLRLVIECNTGLPEQDWESLPLLDNSHGLVVFLAKGNEREIHRRGLARIEDTAPDNAADKILGLAEDMLMDINVFYGNPLLPGLFASTHSRRYFDNEKTAFLRHKGHSESRTLAKAARRDAGHAINVDAYHELWREFLEGWLLPEAVENVFTPKEVKVDMSDAVALRQFVRKIFKDIPALQGQISPVRLVRAYAKFVRRHGGLVGGRCYLAVLVRRPKEERIRQRMKHFFDSGSLHLKRVAFFTHDEMVCNLLNSLSFVQILAIDFTTTSRKP